MNLHKTIVFTQFTHVIVAKKMKLLHVGSEISCIVSFFSKNDFSINDYDNRHMQHLIKMELFL